MDHNGDAAVNGRHLWQLTELADRLLAAATQLTRHPLQRAHCPQAAQAGLVLRQAAHKLEQAVAPQRNTVYWTAAPACPACRWRPRQLYFVVPSLRLPADNAGARCPRCFYSPREPTLIGSAPSNPVHGLPGVHLEGQEARYDGVATLQALTAAPPSPPLPPTPAPVVKHLAPPTRPWSPAADMDTQPPATGAPTSATPSPAALDAAAASLWSELEDLQDALFPLSPLDQDTPRPPGPTVIDLS